MQMQAQQTMNKLQQAKEAKHQLEMQMQQLQVEDQELLDNKRNKRFQLHHHTKSIIQPKNFKILRAFSNQIPNHF